MWHVQGLVLLHACRALIRGALPSPLAPSFCLDDYLAQAWPSCSTVTLSAATPSSQPAMLSQHAMRAASTALQEAVAIARQHLRSMSCAVIARQHLRSTDVMP
jgi:hypothetical protein